MPRALLQALLLAASACSGPPAPDAALCQDVLHRLCLEPRCPAAATLVPQGEACEQELLAITGCGAEDFSFQTPSRQEFLRCRNLLVPVTSDPDTAPACEDVEALRSGCPEVVSFLRGGR